MGTFFSLLTLSTDESCPIHNTNQTSTKPERRERTLSLETEAKYHVQPITCKAVVLSLETAVTEDVMLRKRYISHIKKIHNYTAEERRFINKSFK